MTKGDENVRSVCMGGILADDYIVPKSLYIGQKSLDIRLNDMGVMLLKNKEFCPRHRNVTETLQTAKCAAP